MKNIFALILFAFVSISLTGCDPCKESALTSLGDSVATLGKSGMDKDKILVERKASRAAECAKKQGNELKQGLGL